MLIRIHTEFPKAKIVCSTLMRTTMQSRPDWVLPEKYGGTELEAYYEIIRHTVLEQRDILADTSALNRYYETLDGFHPTRKGKEIIAENWIKCLQESGLFSAFLRQ